MCATVAETMFQKIGTGLRQSQFVIDRSGCLKSPLFSQGEAVSVPPIFKKCQARGGGGGSGNPREFDCVVCPQGGDFDHLIFQLQREEERKPILLTIIFCPGVGILIIFFRKCQNPHPMPDPSPPPPARA